MRKGTKRATGRRAAQEAARRMSLGQLIRGGREKLSQGDARRALELLREAKGRNGGSQELSFLLFSAYSLRSRQFHQKGMTQEASVVRREADSWKSVIDPGSLTEADLDQYLGCLDIGEGLRTYAALSPRGGRSAHIERGLASRVVVDRSFQALSILDPEHPLRLDGQVVEKAIPAMDEGNWEAAVESFRPISRNSPFSPWRLFCKAVSCFCREDDQGLTKSLDMLPEDFILTGVVKALRNAGSWKGDRALPVEGEDLERLLWSSGAEAPQLAKQLADGVRQGLFHKLPELVSALADSLYPEDPLEARVGLLLILAQAVRSDELPLDWLLDLADRLLPPEKAALIAAKIRLLTQEVFHDDWEVEGAAEYLTLLKAEFPDPRQQALARARVLEFLAREGHSGGACPNCLDRSVMETLFSLVDQPSGRDSMLFIDLMRASLKLDPHNREGHRFLISLLRARGGSKSELERALKSMAEHFPEEAEAPLELAKLYDSKNAYRKAEAALEEAERRAPHDEHVRDLRAIGCLRSADRSRARGNYALAERDYRKVARLGRRRLEPVLQVKRLALGLLSAPAPDLAGLKENLRPLEPFDQLRRLTLLICDLEGVKGGGGRKLVGAAKRLLRRKETLLDRLDSAEMVQLLSPIDADWSLLFSQPRVARIWSSSWTRMFSSVQGEDLFALFDLFLDCEQTRLVQKEIERRLKNTRNNGWDPLLLFYLAVVRQLRRLDVGSRRFREVVETTGKIELKRLREAAFRLAPKVGEGPLREALHSFRFEILDECRFADGGLPRDPFPPSPAGPLPDEVPCEGDGLGVFDDLLEMVENLENLIDKSGARGAPDWVVRQLAQAMRLDPELRRLMKKLSQICRGSEELLSREVFILLYPKRKIKTEEKSGRNRSSRVG